MSNRDINLCKVCYTHEYEDHVRPMAGYCPRAGFWQIITDALVSDSRTAPGQGH